MRIKLLFAIIILFILIVSLTVGSIIVINIIKNRTISGIVYDQISGNSISEASVILIGYEETGSLPASRRVFEKEIFTNEKGQFIFHINYNDFKETDYYTLGAYGEFHFHNFLYDIKPIKSNDPDFHNKINLTPGCRIEGYIKDNQGNPINDCKIAFSDNINAFQRFHINKPNPNLYDEVDNIVTTNPFGYFRSDILPIGEIFCLIYHKNYQSYFIENFFIKFGSNNMNKTIENHNYHHNAYGYFTYYDDARDKYYFSGLYGIVYDGNGTAVAIFKTNDNAMYSFWIDDFGTFFLLFGNDNVNANGEILVAKNNYQNNIRGSISHSD